MESGVPNIVIDVIFKLAPKDPVKVQAEIKTNFEYRNSVQDLRYPSAGSIFKNPSDSKLTSGQLLECVGMKKTRIGGAMVSQKHANFIMNSGNATSSDIINLTVKIHQIVKKKFNVNLEPEVQIVVPNSPFKSQ